MPKFSVQIIVNGELQRIKKLYVGNINKLIKEFDKLAREQDKKEE